MPRIKPIRAHDFAPEKKARELTPAGGQQIRPAVARAIAQAVRERIQADKEAIRQSGIRLKDPAHPTRRELQRARITVARRQKFAGLFFQSK